MRHKIREDDIRRKMQTKATSEFVRRVMPDTATSYSNWELSSHEPDLAKHLIDPKVQGTKMPLKKKNNEDAAHLSNCFDNGRYIMRDP